MDFSLLPVQVLARRIQLVESSCISRRRHQEARRALGITCQTKTDEQCGGIPPTEPGLIRWSNLQFQNAAEKEVARVVALLIVLIGNE